MAPRGYGGAQVKTYIAPDDSGDLWLFAQTGPTRRRTDRKLAEKDATDVVVWAGIEVMAGVGRVA